MAKDFSEFFETQDGMASRTFLLTVLTDGRIKAERILTADDPRLSSPKPFLLITVDTFLLSDHEIEVLGDVNRLVEGVGMFKVIRPILAKRRGIDASAFFEVLRDETGDVLLEPDDEVRLGGPGWHVVR
jgi:hypothetical protein